MTRNYSQKDIKLLWGLAAGRCSFPECRIECIIEATDADDHALIGKIAHIVAHGDNGPRCDPTFPKDKRDKYDNLILLCANHHDIVDDQPNTYTVDDLHKWKEDHESWVRESLLDQIPRIGFAELEMAARAIQAEPSDPVADFTLITPQEKMDRNQLTDKLHILIHMGLSKAKEVESFIENISTIDIDFPERLKAGFVNEYKRLFDSGVVGDGLFEALREFASGGSRDFKRQAAGLAILTYLFEKCEVFEK